MCPRTISSGARLVLRVPECHHHAPTWAAPPGPTPAGTDCNKVGVGFKAFRTQPEKCYRPKYDCLNHQIFHHLEDEKWLKANGLESQYLLTRFHKDAYVSGRCVSGLLGGWLPVGS